MQKISDVLGRLGAVRETRFFRPMVAGFTVLAVLGALVAFNPGPKRPKDLGSNRVRAADDPEATSTTVAGPVEGIPAPDTAGTGAAVMAGGTTKPGSRVTSRRSSPSAKKAAAARSGAAGKTAGAASGAGGAAATGGSTGSGGGSAETSGAGESAGSSTGSGGAAEPGGCGFEGCAGAQGVTESSILIGVPYSPNADSAPLKPPDLIFGNARDQADALIKDINARGGIGGRTLRASYVQVDDNRLAVDADGEAQRQCQVFTEQQKVFAVLTNWARPVFASCMAKRRTLVFRTGQALGSEASVQSTAPWVWTPPDKNATRLWRTLLPELNDNGFFQGTTKVGLVVLGDAAYTTVANEVKETLESAYKHSVEVFTYPAFTDADIMSKAVQAEAQFHSRGVNRVLFIPGFVMSSGFMQAAEGQGHRQYRYALDSSMVLYKFLSKSPPAQLEGSRGIGWKPASDLGPTYNGGNYTPREQQCVNVMQKAGIRMVDRDNPSLALQSCEVFWAFEEAAKRAGRGLNSGSFVAGLRSLGNSWPSVYSFMVDFGRGVTDASFGHRLIKWNGTAFAYSGDTRGDR